MTASQKFDGPWSRHSQEAWKDHAANPRYPLPLRVAFLAYGNHKANGHARFKTGEVAQALAKLDHGEWIIPSRNTVWRAIQQAIDFGLLAADSKSLCLIVPSHHISGGLGDENAPCDRHPRRRTNLRAVS